MKNLFQKYKELIAYLVFGGLTTVINIVVFFICQNILAIDYKISNAIAWFLSVLFAFITNKYLVFKSKQKDKRSFIKEMALFYWYRFVSFIIDMGMMIFFVDLLHTTDMLAKVITQIVIIIINYVFSKLFIFSKKKDIDDNL
ncbi:GtrA family protein [Melissococcus plutonius]|uniref:Teichoic acid glycosylation protein n=2 Tax=Melissococcus plutonius TaxID=33970 RepID=F3YBY2_MELPT|nr:GtrA family protein [Melissococcus plutonius]BAL61737.1 putative teichoic acid glycosylation protein [Melissococcus plutonius DAT561]AIM25276.1 putative membrane protein [Melissococcus plutonius S1]KMT23961.1 putative membrane protein [Melissococcus plutonius]KMT24484.1 putative membrane protein [Melissococcus plutonius]KMT26057.1 putative membrane protein [Melissococcus plutonius]